MLEVLIYLTGDITLARYKSDGITDPMDTPVKTPYGLVRNGIIQVGEHSGEMLFDAARRMFSK